MFAGGLRREVARCCWGVRLDGSWDMSSVEPGGVRPLLPLITLGILVPGHGRDATGRPGCCWSSSRAPCWVVGAAWPSGTPSSSCAPCYGPIALPWTGRLWLSSLICRALFRGALGSMRFYVTNRVLKVARGVVCRARTRVSFLCRLPACSRPLESLATFNE